MSKYIYADIIDGLDLTFDLVESWLPLLINPDDSSNVDCEHFQLLDSSLIAVAGLAAVEQYASTKKLRQGTVEDFRMRSYHIFKSIQDLNIFHNGQLHVLEGLQIERPELANWVQDAVMAIRNKKEKARNGVIEQVKCLLIEIRSQQARKGHKGGRIQAFGGKEKNPALHFRDQLDSELMNDAVGTLPIGLRNNISEIKKQLRPLVKDWINRAVLRSGHLTINEATDTHCKRIYRKLDKLVERGIFPRIPRNLETESEETPANDRKTGGTSGN